MLVDARGVPLSLIVAGANEHDVTLVRRTLRQRHYRRVAHLCADKGYWGKPGLRTMRHFGYRPHVPARGTKPRPRRSTGQARRWVVEGTHSWFNRYRKLLVRFEKTAASYEALLYLASALIAFRRNTFIYG